MSPNPWAAEHPGAGLTQLGWATWPQSGRGASWGSSLMVGRGLSQAANRAIRSFLGRTSAGEPGVRICVHEKLHLEQVSYLLGVEGQDPFEQHHVRGVDSDRLLLPANHRAGDGLGGARQEETGARAAAWESRVLPPST